MYFISVCMHASTYVCMYVCTVYQRVDGVRKYVSKSTVYMVCKLFEYNYMWHWNMGTHMTRPVQSCRPWFALQYLTIISTTVVVQRLQYLTTTLV